MSAKKTDRVPPPSLQLQKSPGLAILLWQRDDSEEMELELAFRTVAGGQGRLTIPRDWRRSPKRVLSRLEARGAVLPMEQPLKVLAELLMTENLSVHRLTSTPGWHHGTFARARRRVRTSMGSDHQFSVRVAEGGPTYVDHIKGTSRGWRRRVGAPARQSTTMSFAILVGLAAPLAARAGLSEGALFNFFAGSSVGKTTLARVAASVAGDPARIGSWNSSKRGAEEYAAAHNGYALILDDTEKGAGDLTGLMRAVTHIITGGQSRTYSVSVQDQLRPLSWFCFGLSTSPESLSALARRGRFERTAGERVRLIDLPIPDQARGGIFDRLSPGAGAIGDRARAAIDAIEQGIASHHGRLFVDWREVFLDLDPDKISEQVAAIEASMPVGDSLDGRLRRKFAIVRVTGELANEHGILDWPIASVAEVVDAMLAAARTELRGDDKAREAGWSRLQAALDDPNQVAPLANGNRLARSFDGLLGVRGQRRGFDVVALRGKGVQALFGGNLETFLAPIRARNGLIVDRRDDADTLQFPIRPPGHEKSQRHRLYTVRIDILTQVIAERAGSSAAC